VIRYVQAFFQALGMTLRGEKPDPTTALVREWLDVLAERVHVIQSAAAKQSLDMGQVIVHVDKRDLTMKTIVELLQYRAQTEYPNLLSAAGKSGWAVIYTSNHNDVYYVSRLIETLADSPLKQAVVTTKAHLEALPLKPDSL
jgi:beta-lactamase class D